MLRACVAELKTWMTHIKVQTDAAETLQTKAFLEHVKTLEILLPCIEIQTGIMPDIARQLYGDVRRLDAGMVELEKKHLDCSLTPHAPELMPLKDIVCRYGEYLRQLRVDIRKSHAGIYACLNLILEDMNALEALIREEHLEIERLSSTVDLHQKEVNMRSQKLAEVLKNPILLIFISLDTLIEGKNELLESVKESSMVLAQRRARVNVLQDSINTLSSLGRLLESMAVALHNTENYLNIVNAELCQIDESLDDQESDLSPDVFRAYVLVMENQLGMLKRFV